MLGWAVIIAAAFVMYGIAEAEDRSGPAWAFLTVASCLVCAAVIPLPFINLMIGFGAAFFGMMVAKMASAERPAAIRR